MELEQFPPGVGNASMGFSTAQMLPGIVVSLIAPILYANHYMLATVHSCIKYFKNPTSLTKVATAVNVVA